MMKKNSPLTTKMLAAYCDVRINPVLGSEMGTRIYDYLVGLLHDRSFPPFRGSRIDWERLAFDLDLPREHLSVAQRTLRPVLDAIVRTLCSTRMLKAENQRSTMLSRPKHSKHIEKTDSAASIRGKSLAEPGTARKRSRTGYAPKPVVDYPVPLWNDWVEPETFALAISLHMRRHGDTAWHLHRAIVRRDETFDRKTIASWCSGHRIPRSENSFEILRRIEKRYGLPAGYFKEKLSHKARSVTRPKIEGISLSEQRRLAWHLPEDFSFRPKEEQAEILKWVHEVVISGSTEYRRYQAAAARQRYAIRFKGLGLAKRRTPNASTYDPDFTEGVRAAPEHLEAEMAELLRFKTSTLTSFGYQRNGVWNEETAAQKIEHLGLMFGALAASPRSTVKGYGVPLESLSFGLLVFPAVWDWYLQWRERRRGFFTAWEEDMLRVGLALTRQETGWLRQTPAVAARLQPIPGLVSEAEIHAAHRDWDAACDIFYKHGTNRVKEVHRVSKVHRDPFEPILSVLEADSPVAEYRKITEEILRLMPDGRRHPRAAAEAVRSFLMLRLGLHLGVRQKNLRQLLFCPRDQLPKTERQLEELRCGELRWSERENGWEVLIPSIAFKNSTSSFFGSKPFRLVLPDLGQLYRYIDDYIDRHRARLLNGASDPSTFFVKTVKLSSANAAYSQTTFYEAWRLTIQRYGIYNPWTNRGAIKGLLPHGPHNVRDVLATHILKQTGSYEQASYAIQDTPEMVAQHYGRFLPQDKAALAARILNKVWEAA